MTDNLTLLDKKMIEEAKDGKPLWEFDPYKGQLKKEKVQIKDEKDIEMYLAKALVNVKEDDPNLGRLPMLGIKDSLKKEIDAKYKLDKLRQLEKLDALINLKE